MNIFERARYTAYKRLETWMSKSKESTRTLVIIDMQDSFLNNIQHNLTPTVCQLIKYAKQNMWPIILVEFEGSGRTISTIIEVIDNYHNWTTVIKDGMDGGQEIIECVNNHPAWSFNLLVCGVYGNQCVRSTVAGLFNNSNLVEVDVVTDAVYPSYCTSSKKDERGQQKEREVVVEDVCNLVNEREIR